MRKTTGITLKIFALTVLLMCVFAVSAAADTAVPGLNIFTGTLDAFDFEGDVSSVCFNREETTDENGNTLNAVVTRATDSSETNKAAAVEGMGTKAYMYFNTDFPVIDVNRPMILSYDYIVGIDGNQVRVLVNYPDKITNLEKASFVIHYYNTAQTTEVWRNHSKTVKGADVCNAGATYYEGGYDISSMKWCNYSGNAQVSYFDNISCIPYYKITYDLNGGTGDNTANEYFYVDEGESYTFANTGAGIERANHMFMGWALSADATEEDVVTSVVATPGYDVTLYAVWKRLPSVLPGCNVYTGTESVLDFESELSGVSLYDGAVVETKAKGTDTDNKALAFKAQCAYLALDTYPEIEGARPLKINFDYIYNGQTRLAVNCLPKSALNSADLFYLFSNTSHQTAWKSYSATRQADAEGNTGSGVYTYYKTANDTMSAFYIYSFSAVTEEQPTYIDNLSIVPYYKVSFNLCGGKGVAEPEYFLADAGSKYTVLNNGEGITRRGFIFKGWATKKGASAEDVVTDVTVTLGEDITLYAVWEKDESYECPILPGLNLFTDTAEPFDFEGDNSIVLYTGAEGYTENTVLKKETNTNSDNMAVCVAPRKAVYFDIPMPVIEMERPIQIKADYIYNGQLRFLINNSNSPETHVLHLIHQGSVSTNWKSFNVSKSSKEPYTYSNGVTYYNGGQDISSVYFYNYSSTNVNYYDNLSVIPFYKITYDLNGGSGAADAEYFLVDEGQSYTLLETGSTIFRNGYAFCGWATTADATQEDVITSVVAVPGEDIKLYAVWTEDETVQNKYYVELYDDGERVNEYIVNEGNFVTLPYDRYTDDAFLLGWQTEDGTMLTVKFAPDSDVKLYAKWQPKDTQPGVNVFKNHDFEDTDNILVRPSNGVLTVVTEQDGNNVLKYQRNSDYASIQHHITWDPGRKYLIEYKVKLPVEAYSNYNPIYGDTNHNEGIKVVADTWTTHTKEYTFPADTEESIYTAKNSDAISLYANPLTGAEENVVYYDDVKVIPYYKVTYDATGGTGAPETEYFLDSYTVNTDTVPTREGYEFLGWALKNGSINCVTEITGTPGSDITLYASWENISALDAIKYDYASTEGGIANGVITITLNDETASYTTAEILLANNDGVLEDYTPFGTVTFADGTATYTVTGNRAFPAEATRLAVKFMADDLSDLYYWYTIPEEHRLTVADEPLFSFYAASDFHLGGTSYTKDYWPTITVNRSNAIKDIFSSEADFFFVNGDVIDHGMTAYANVLSSYINDVIINPEYNPNGIPMFLINGNHEYHNTDHSTGGTDVDDVHGVFFDHIAYLKQQYPDIEINCDEENMWYTVDVMGAKFIYLSSPEVSQDHTTVSYAYSDKQLKFLEEELYNGEKSNETIFVVSHVPMNKMFLKDDSGTYGSGVTAANTALVMEILEDHPNVVWFSGHTHSDLSVDKAHYTIVGDMTTTPTFINEGAIAHTGAWNGEGDDGTTYKKTFGTSVYVEVYEDKIVARGRKFVEDSVYFGHGVYVIDRPDSDKTVADVAISGEIKDGATLTALVDGKVPSADDNYTYSWIVGGNVVGTDSTFTLDYDKSYSEQKIILRVTDSNGCYASCISDDRVEALDIAYIECEIGNMENDTESYVAEFESEIKHCIIIAAAYDKDGNMLMTDVVTPEHVFVDKVVTAKVEKSLGADYVRFYALSDETFGPLCKDALSEGNMITNGDAEDTENTAVFISENATLTIVDDAEMGNVWKAQSAGGKHWVYFRQNVTYVPGATYTARAKVKLLGTTSDSAMSSNVYFNTVYIDADGKADHAPYYVSGSTDGWVSLEYTFTIPEDTTDRSRDQLAIYCNPYNELGVSYLIDDVELHRIK